MWTQLTDSDLTGTHNLAQHQAEWKYNFGAHRTRSKKVSWKHENSPVCFSGRYFFFVFSWFGLFRTEEVLLLLDSTFTDPGSSACPQQQPTTTHTPPSATGQTEEVQEEEEEKSVCQAPPTRVCNWSILGTVRNGPIKSSIVVLCVQAHYFLMMRAAASIQSSD